MTTPAGVRLSAAFVVALVLHVVMLAILMQVVVPKRMVAERLQVAIASLASPAKLFPAKLAATAPQRTAPDQQPEPRHQQRARPSSVPTGTPQEPNSGSAKAPAFHLSQFASRFSISHLQLQKPGALSGEAQQENRDEDDNIELPDFLAAAVARNAPLQTSSSERLRRQVAALAREPSPIVDERRQLVRKENGELEYRKARGSRIDRDKYRGQAYVPSQLRRERKVRPLPWRRRDFVPTDDGGFAFKRRGFSASIEEDGAMAFRDNPGSAGFGESAWSDVAGFGWARDFTSGGFDLTDVLMRAAGGDPYDNYKRTLQKDTYAIRVQMHERNVQMRTGQAMPALRQRLEKIWANRALSERQRRRLFFLLWDECNDEGSGQHARRVILSFIATRLPVGSFTGYSEGELVALNQERDSARPFEPYSLSGRR